MNRYMRLLLMFDLPTVTKSDRKIAADFRKSLLDDGFVMIQFSVYVRICRNQDDFHKHLRRVQSFVPVKGNVRILQITENQYDTMRLLVGEKNRDEQYDAAPLIVIE